MPQRTEKFYRFIGDNLDTHLEGRRQPAADDEDSSDESDDDLEEAKGGEGRGIFKKLKEILAYCAKKVWSGIVWIFGSDANAGVVRNENTLRLESSLEFNRLFK